MATKGGGRRPDSEAAQAWPATWRYVLPIIFLRFRRIVGTTTGRAGAPGRRRGATSATSAPSTAGQSIAPRLFIVQSGAVNQASSRSRSAAGDLRCASWRAGDLEKVSAASRPPASVYAGSNMDRANLRAHQACSQMCSRRTTVADLLGRIYEYFISDSSSEEARSAPCPSSTLMRVEPGAGGVRPMLRLGRDVRQ
jgi:hypothetical protein